VEQQSNPVNDIIVSMHEKGDEIWLAGSSAIYRTHITDSTFVIREEIALNNIFLDDVNIMDRQDTLYFVNSQGYYYYDPESKKVVENEQLKNKIGPPVHHLYDQVAGTIWAFNGKTWHHLGQAGQITPVENLGLFPDLRAISVDESTGHLWLLTEQNDVLTFDPEKMGGLESFGFFLKQVSNERGALDQSRKFTLSYDENFLSIELSKPDFLGLLNPEFQFKLEGLHSEWSDWTRSRFIDFSYLPEGEYKLKVRSRDAFGRTEEADVLEFVVKPPYWQTTWFYAIQVVFFGALVYFSTRLNQNNSTNRLLSGALTLLTLVLIIEFLQSAIGSLIEYKSTPVTDFLLDASIAFMIFPLERLLRELMTKGKVNMKIKAKDIRLSRKHR